jgi:hypothetical protein
MLIAREAIMTIPLSSSRYPLCLCRDSSLRMVVAV